MSKERRTALLKAQLGWGCKCSILSLFGLQAGANIGGEKALEKAWSESMSGLSSRGDGDEVKTRIQSTLRRARSNINPAIPVPKEDQYSIGQSPTSDQSTESDTQPQAKSRWEELRASKRPESAWERIRQQRPSAADIANEGTSTTGPGRNEESPKDQRIKDLESFQQMMEEERKGKDSFN